MSNIIAAVCGYTFMPFSDCDIKVSDFLGLAFSSEANRKGAKEALQKAVRPERLFPYDFDELYVGAEVFFFSLPDLKPLGQVRMEAEEVIDLLEGPQAEDNGEDLIWLISGEPRPVNLGDLEPFAPPDDLEDIYVEPDRWDE